MTTTAFDFTIPQCYLMQSLRKGWPVALLKHLLPRCSASKADLDALLMAGLIDVVGTPVRYQLSPEGRRQFHLRSQRKDF